MEEKFRRNAAYQNLIGMLRELQKTQEQQNPEIFKSFMGFGALKELLLPLDDKTQWTKTDLQAEHLVQEVHGLFQDIFKEKYSDALNSIKTSMLSSFFTPAQLCASIIEGLALSGEKFDKVLDPSAGNGKFIEEIRHAQALKNASVTAIEKDIVTSRFLAAAQPGSEVIHSGFEQFKNRNFDLVISNIPFGSFGVFDDAMFREANPVKIKATTRIRNEENEKKICGKIALC